MFAHMAYLLQSGETPPPETIRPRLNAALVKKLAVIRQPYSFWSSDPKSNPRTRHMLWATVLLEDKVNYGVVCGILALEEQERARVRQGETSVPSVDRLAASAISDLLEIIADKPNEQDIRRRIVGIAGPEIIQLIQKS